MKICLYVGKAPRPEQQAEWLANAKTTCDVYASNLHREFTSRGHEVVFASSLAARPRDCSEEDSAKRLARYEKMEFPEADHAICLEQNGWKFREPYFFERARAATSGLVCAICDHDQVMDGPQDLLFTARRPNHPHRAKYVGWAADLQTFTPEKDPEWLTIFVDHKYDPTERHDDTEALLKSATSYAARLASEDRRVGNPPRRVQVVFFSPEGIERIEPSEVRDVHLGNDRRTFYRRVPGPELAAWTRKADIFVVTHGESMGLPVLENAMAGALIVARRGFVKPELLRSLAHHEYDRVESLDWDSLTAHLNPARFRRRASHFTWGQVAERMLDAFTNGHVHASTEPRRMGNLLVAPPRPMKPGLRLGDLGSWRRHHMDVVPSPDGHRLVPSTEKPLHYVRRDIGAHPWPETYTVSVKVRPNGRDDLVVWLAGEFDDERAEVRFDASNLRASPGRTTNGWVLLDADVVRVGEDVLCHMVVQSDWAPVVRCYLLLARGPRIEFQADADEPGLEVSSFRLSHGVGLVAHLEEEADSPELAPARRLG